MVLVNSNPATIATDPHMADSTYIEPLEHDTLAAIIRKGKAGRAAPRPWAARSGLTPLLNFQGAAFWMNAAWKLSAREPT